MPSISIITACYNHGKYIHEMIDSVLNQTFQDFEIVIVNDGSSDDTKEVLDAIKHEKIRVIHSEHKGPSHARNLAIYNSNADIIFNLDADDKISKNLLKNGYDAFHSHPNAGIVYAETMYFGAKRGSMRFGLFKLEKMLKANQIVSAAFFRKDDWFKCGGYSEKFIYGLEDWDLWLSILELGRDVIKVTGSCFFYRKYNSPKLSRSGKRNSDRTKALESILLIYGRHQLLYSQFPNTNKNLSKYLTENRSLSYKRFNNPVFPVKYRISLFVNWLLQKTGIQSFQ